MQSDEVGTSRRSDGDLDARARALDDGDELAEFRARFVVPDPSLVYFDGNSLGRLPIAAAERVRRVVEAEWGGDLIGSWEQSWIDLPGRIGDLIGTGLLGARAGETIVSDSTTVNLYKLCHAALDARSGRATVVAERDAFPTDRYVLEGIARTRDLQVRWLDSDPVEGVSAEQVADALDAEVALLWLEHVHYRSAAIADMAAITEAAHQAGALTLWDVCHSVGTMPIDLEASGADLAVGCTYKYLNGGPGAPSFLYVRAEHQASMRQPIWGWWGRAAMFEMEPGYEPTAGVRANLTGTPPILSTAPIEDGAGMLIEAGIDRVRAKGMSLTSFAVELFDRMLAPAGFELRSPRDARRRGSHITVTHPDARRLCGEMAGRGVIPDFRQPNGIRIGLAPLTTSFDDVLRGIRVLAQLAGG
jgi:kynureninase